MRIGRSGMLLAAAMAWVAVLAQVRAEDEAPAAPPPPSIVDHLTRAENASAEKTADGLRIKVTGKKDEGKIFTAEEFKAPLVIMAGGERDCENRRLFFGGKGRSAV